MRAVIQRVSTASVTIAGELTAEIGPGYLVLLGVETDDEEQDVNWLVKKIAHLRVMPDDQGLMNRDIKDTGGEVLVVSQFTLHASYKKGNRPSFIKAARPDKAIPMYELFVQQLEGETGKKVKTGRFGADMKVALVNDGPVTIVMDSKDPE